jgi:hypothetical protein
MSFEPRPEGRGHGPRRGPCYGRLRLGVPAGRLEKRFVVVSAACIGPERTPDFVVERAGDETRRAEAKGVPGIHPPRRVNFVHPRALMARAGVRRAESWFAEGWGSYNKVEGERKESAR